MSKAEHNHVMTLHHRGHFADALAEAWFKADSGNRARLEGAFPDYFFPDAGLPKIVPEMLDCAGGSC